MTNNSKDLTVENRVEMSNLPQPTKDIILNLVPFMDKDPAIKKRIVDLLQLEEDFAAYQAQKTEDFVRGLEELEKYANQVGGKANQVSAIGKNKSALFSKKE